MKNDNNNIIAQLIEWFKTRSDKVPKPRIPSGYIILVHNDSKGLRTSIDQDLGNLSEAHKMQLNAFFDQIKKDLSN